MVAQIAIVFILFMAMLAVVLIASTMGWIGPTITRFFMFWFGCIPIRSMIAFTAFYVAYNNQDGIINYMDTILPFMTGLISVGFASTWVRGIQWKKLNGNKLQIGGFGGPVYWQDQRLAHSLLYGMFTVGHLMGWKNAYLLLVADVMLGGVTNIAHNLSVLQWNNS